MNFREYDYKICQILMKLSELERSAEITRRVITDSINYEPLQLFKKLDIENKNYISPQNLIDFAFQNNINIFKEEAEFIIYFYDKDQDGLLSFDELINLIQSKNPKYINNKNIINYNSNFEINYNIEFSFIKLIEKEVKLVQNMMNYLDNLNLLKFDLHDIYHKIKSINVNCITKESLKNFLEKNNISFLDSDINYIFNRLDINKNGKIDYVEFHSFFGFPNCLYISPFNICPFCGTKCCDDCLSGIDRFFPNNIKEEYIYRKNEDIYNKINDINKEKKLIFTPERNNNSIDFNINDTIYNNKEINNDLKTDNNYLGIEKISNSLSLRNGIERKYAPFEVEIIKTNFEEKLEDVDIINFNNYLKDLIDGEIEIESYKVDLALKQDFNCEDFFRLFEYEGQGYISQDDLIYGFNLLNIKSNEEIINLLMKRFDLLKENKLNYGDFFDMIVSFQISYRNLIEKRIPISRNPGNILNLIDQSTISCFKVLIVFIIEFEYRINNIRKKINLKKEKIKALFKMIDENNNGFLVYDDLIKYLIKNNINYNNQLGIDLLFIRLDKQRKGKLFLDNFLDELIII